MTAPPPLSPPLSHSPPHRYGNRHDKTPAPWERAEALNASSRAEEAHRDLKRQLQTSIKLLARARENQKASASGGGGGGGGGGGEGDGVVVGELKKLKKRLQQLKASGDCL